MASNHSKGLVDEAKDITDDGTTAVEDALSLLWDDDLSTLSHAFVVIAKSFEDVASALEETSKKIDLSSQELFGASKDFYACSEAIKSIKKTAKIIKEQTQLVEYGAWFNPIVNSVNKLTKDSRQAVAALDTITARIVKNVDRQISINQPAFGMEASFSEGSNTSIEEVTSAIADMTGSMEAIQVGSQEIIRLSEAFSECVKTSR
ncbi:MAG: hypothetical protein ACE5OZ_06540 [Candidatus Heimdallarchaeota archaeon]